MREPVFIPPGEGELLGDAPDRRVEVLSDDDTLDATWTRFGPRRDGAELHIHYEHTDFFYVLEGELTLRLGLEGETAAVRAGTLAYVLPGIVHGFRNDTDAELRFVNLHAPGPRFIEYMRARRDGLEFSFDQYDPPEDGGLPTSGAVVGNVELVADRPSLRVQLLADVEALGISESTAEPGGPSPPQHVHRRHVDSFYVLAGELTFTVAGRELRATAGTWVQVPPGTPHTFALTGSDEVRFLNLHTPSRGYGAFLRGLHKARSDEDLAAVRAAFDQEPV